MLATAESTNNPIVGPPLPASLIPVWEQKFNRKYEVLPGIPHDSWEDILKRRQLGQTLAYTDPEDNNRPAPIRLIEDEPTGIFGQYSEPQEIARRLIASYARHIARTSPDPNDRTNAVKAVRVYRVMHNLLSPREYSEGKDPLDKATFLPFYMGKYDPDGRLLDPKDPFLFWHLPIIKVPRRYPEAGTFLAHQQPPEEPLKSIDFVEIHATQSDKLQQPSADE
jgi:hypothetical protein